MFFTCSAHLSSAGEALEPLPMGKGQSRTFLTSVYAPRLSFRSEEG